MAFKVTTRCWVLLVFLIYVSFLGFKLGNASEDLPGTDYGDDDDDAPQTGAAGGDVTTQTGAAGGDVTPHSGSIDGDPAQIVAKALLCFNDKLIYKSCEEAYRLTAAGHLDVPLEYTDQFCSGPCLEETHLVLNCIDHILSNFLFYNKATIEDVKETIHAGCSYTSERGNFNVAEHVQDEESSANKAGITILFGILSMVIGCLLLI